jgi:hypothetical protein
MIRVIAAFVLVSLSLAAGASAATPAQADAKVIACFHRSHVTAKRTTSGVIATFPGYYH